MGATTDEQICLDPRGQASLWEHMAKRSIIRLVSGEQYRDRREILDELRGEVLGGGYATRPIHGYLSSTKGKGVARFLPVLSHVDVSVLFGCVKLFDEKLAELAVEGTYGGWSLGGQRRDFEERQAKALFATDPPVNQTEHWGDDSDVGSDSVPPSAYNRWAWVENWGQFWKLVAATHENSPHSASFAVFDIANFYDTIDLHRLERYLRRHV